MYISAKTFVFLAASFFILLALGIYVFTPAPKTVTVEKPDLPKTEPVKTELSPKPEPKAPESKPELPTKLPTLPSQLRIVGVNEYEIRYDPRTDFQTNIKYTVGQKIRILKTWGSVIWDKEWPAVGPEGGPSPKSLHNYLDFPLTISGAGCMGIIIGHHGFDVVGDIELKPNPWTQEAYLKIISNNRKQNRSESSGNHYMIFSLQ
jgi:hypothetical protein